MLSTRVLRPPAPGDLGIIHALDSSDADQESRTSAIVISGGDSDGKVTAYVSLSKFPPV